MTDPKTDYWETLFQSGAALTEAGSWRQVCDQLYRDQIAQWVGDFQTERALKTDLYDESFGLGLVPDLFRNAQEVSGVDISGAIVSRAAENHPGLTAMVGDVRDLPFDEGTFGFVLSNSTLDHFDTEADIHAALRDLYRVMAPGGLMYISLDNPANPVLALRRILPFKLLNRLGLMPYFCGATLGAGPLKAALEAVGFQVRRTGFLMHVQRVLAVQICRLADWLRMPALTRTVVRATGGAEVLAHFPTARFTGHYVVALAEKPR